MAENKNEILDENIIVLFDEEENKEIPCEWLDSVEYEGSTVRRALERPCLIAPA